MAASLGVAMLVGLLTGFPDRPAQAEPSGTPQYRALAGVGSTTTQELMNALSNVVTVNGQKVLASYDAARPLLPGRITTKDPATHPDCTLNRPGGDASGQSALQYSIAAEDGCLDFARLAGEPDRQSISPAHNVTYRPYALDGITYATNLANPMRPPSLEFLRLIYTCADVSPLFHPLLPAAGSQLRSEWLTALNIPESDVSAGKYPCVKDTSEGQPIRENYFTPVLADPYAILPISIAKYVAGGWAGIRIGDIQAAPESDGRGPVVPNTEDFPEGVGYAVLDEMPIQLTLAELLDLYQCRNTSFGITPLLPAAGPVRSAWLRTMHITEAEIAEGRYPCIRDTRSDGSPIAANDGTGLQDTEIIPYSIAEYLRQAAGHSGGSPIPDKRAGRRLGSVPQGGGVVARPFALNPNYGRPLVHRLYNVIPMAKQRTSPWREVFTGPDSLICQNTAIIKTHGFTPLAPEACGGGDLPLDPPPPSYQIRNLKSGKCLAIDGAGTANAAPAVQRTCGSGPEQRWSWSGADGRQLKNTHSGKCLAIGGGNTAKGAQAIQWPCGSGSEQQWILLADPHSTETSIRNVKSALILSVSGASTADGAKVIQWTANGGPEQAWTLLTATTLAPGGQAPVKAADASTGAGDARTGKAAGNEWVTVRYPKQLVDVRHGRCRMQGYWSTKAVRPGSGPIGGMFLDTRAYVVGPKCAVTMQFQVINYQQRRLWIFTADHNYDASKPSSSGHNERWMFWGPILGGGYEMKIGNVIYLLSYSLQDMTAGTNLSSVGQVWGPKANWCDGWVGPGGCPTTN
ncbi:RICIN domain-containing protein [Nonomuraea antimicrobica]|uniref:RICIN domain-containing protein n=1 Tax=Nonomuraea antimicrobica TaxID=561173 RepID=UPI0031ECD48A